MVVRPDLTPGLPEIVGFENHRAGTVLEPGATPLGACLLGYGNDPTAPEGQGATASCTAGSSAPTCTARSWP